MLSACSRPVKQEDIGVCNGYVDHQDMHFPSEGNLMQILQHKRKETFKLLNLFSK